MQKSSCAGVSFAIQWSCVAKNLFKDAVKFNLCLVKEHYKPGEQIQWQNIYVVGFNSDAKTEKSLSKTLTIE